MGKYTLPTITAPEPEQVAPPSEPQPATTGIKPKITQPEVLALVEAAGLLDEEIKAAEIAADLAKKRKRLRELHEKILELATGDAPPGLERVGMSDQFMVKIGPQANRTEVTDKAKLIELLQAVDDDPDAELGLEIRLAKYGLTELKKYLSGAQYELVTTTTQDGARRLAIERIE